MSEEQEDKNPQEEAQRRASEFSEKLSELLHEYGVEEYAGVFVIGELPIISFSPNTIVATRLLKHAHNQCRADVMNQIGE